mgnify:CR=1 FL=1
MYIPKSLNHSNITDNEIKAYYSLFSEDKGTAEYNKRWKLIFHNYMKNTQNFSTKNAEYSFKKRLNNWLKDPPNNSKVWNAFISWRFAQVNLHIAKQRDTGFYKDKSNDKNKDDLIKNLRNEVSEQKMIIQKLREELDQLKSNNEIVDIQVDLETSSSEEDLVEEVSSDEEVSVEEEVQVDLEVVVEEVVEALVQQLVAEQEKENEKVAKAKARQTASLTRRATRRAAAQVAREQRNQIEVKNVLEEVINTVINENKEEEVVVKEVLEEVINAVIDENKKEVVKDFKEASQLF